MNKRMNFTPKEWKEGQLRKNKISSLKRVTKEENWKSENVRWKMILHYSCMVNSIILELYRPRRMPNSSTNAPCVLVENGGNDSVEVVDLSSEISGWQQWGFLPEFMVIQWETRSEHTHLPFWRGFRELWVGKTTKYRAPMSKGYEMVTVHSYIAKITIQGDVQTHTSNSYFRTTTSNHPYILRCHCWYLLHFTKNI